MKLLVNQKDMVDLQTQRFLHPHPRVQLKMDVVLLKAHNLPHSKIASITGVCENTARTYLEEYKQGGIEDLKKLNFNKPVSALDSAKDIIKSHFEKHPPASIKEAAAEIEKLTGIKRGRTQVRKFLQSMGMRRLKTGTIPAKADAEKQEVFKNERLIPRLEEAQRGERVVFFVDAAHFVFAPFLGILWCFTRIFIKAPSGRMRFNVLGALNAITHELVTVTNNTYINGMSVCELLHSIAEQNVNVPITLILDNARYQKCAIVQQLADLLKIELLYLPPYSPNLNLIERMWKFTKKQCLNSTYYTDFQVFSDAISDFLKNVHVKHKTELESLLTHKFQKFNVTKLL